MAGWYGRCVFNLLKNYQVVFQSSCAIFHSHHHCVIEFLLLSNLDGTWNGQSSILVVLMGVKKRNLHFSRVIYMLS